MRKKMGIVHTVRALIFAAPFFIASAAHAQTPKAGSNTAAAVFYEARSKYMFGFLDGADIGNEGEKAFK